MRLRHLEIFHAVMRTGSVSGAADVLNLSQSAASKALSQAEHSIGLRLFNRVAGRLISTREAERLFAQTSIMFAQAERIQRLARDLKRDPADQLRIGCLPSLGLGLIPEVLQDFRQRCPKVSIEVVTCNGDEMMERMLAQELDIGVCFRMSLKQGLECSALGRIKVVHLSADAAGTSPDSPVSLQSLDWSQYIGIGGGDPLAQEIEDACIQLHLERPDPGIETRTYYVAAALARQRLGFALVDELTASIVGTNVQTRMTAPEIAVEVVAIYTSKVQRSVAFDTLVHALEGKLQHL
ncbi:MAG: LysR family transcriptional regulator [Acidovorax sp.]|jgi:DNA-binding transcriptional LysR family regulator|nr:LysR family transcriptional regulator [Acidovorax sp.]